MQLKFYYWRSEWASENGNTMKLWLGTEYATSNREMLEFNKRIWNMNSEQINTRKQNVYVKCCKPFLFSLSLSGQTIGFYFVVKWRYLFAYHEKRFKWNGRISKQILTFSVSPQNATLSQHFSQPFRRIVCIVYFPQKCDRLFGRWPFHGNALYSKVSIWFIFSLPKRN